MRRRIFAKKTGLLLLVFLFPMINGCFCTYDITYRVAGNSENVDIVYSADGSEGHASGVDLSAGDWRKKDELVDFWESDCQEDDPWTEEDESANIFCQEEDETFEIYVQAINRQAAIRSITVYIYVDGDRVAKRENLSVPQHGSVSVTYNLDDLK